MSSVASRCRTFCWVSMPGAFLAGTVAALSGAGRGAGVSPSHRRICSPSWSSSGGAVCVVSVVSAVSAALKNRSGGPGRLTVPRILCSTSITRPCEWTCSHS